MLHMVLVILKIIGVLVGILLLLLLGVLCALVFVPVRYRLTAVRKPDRLEFSLRMSWLLHLLSAAVTAGASGRTIAVRLFGFRLPLFKEKGAKKPKKEVKKKPEKEKAGAHTETSVIEDAPRDSDTREQKSHKPEQEAPESRESEQKVTEPHEPETSDSHEPGQGAPESHESAQAEQSAPDLHIEASGVEDVPRDSDTREPETPRPQEAKPEEPEQEAPEPHEPETPKQPKQSILGKIWFQCRRVCDKIRKIPQAIKLFCRRLARLRQRVAKLRRKAIELLQKPGQLIEFLEEYEAAEIFGGLTGHLVYLISHYKPRRIQGYLKFGTGDPASTGQLTGLIYLMLPARADRFDVVPEFNEKVFETEVTCSGRIRAVHVLCVLLRGFRDKKLRRLIRKLRKRGES